MPPPVPQGKGRETDTFNDFLRADPEYRAKLQALGVNPDAPVQLSGSQRAQMEQFVRQKFPNLPGKFQIDPAGNVNTDHGLSTAWSNPYFRTALIAGGTLGVGMAVAPAAFGIGAGGSGAAGAGAGSAAAGGTLASSSLPAASLMGGLGAGGTAGLGTAVGSGTAAGLTGASMAGGGGLLGTLGNYGRQLIPDDASGWMDLMGDVGGLASDYAKGSNAGRMAEGNQALQFAQLGQSGARDKFAADMSGASFAREGQDRERKAQILSSLLGNMQDVKHTPGNPKIAAAMGNSVGGARPSNLTANKEALMALLGQPQVQAPTYQAPDLPGMPKASGFDKAMGGIGLGTNILSLLGRNRRQGAPVQE